MLKQTALLSRREQRGQGKLFLETLNVLKTGEQGDTTDKQYIFPRQCLVLGDSEVGKTSLVKSLTGKPFDPIQQKTHGIDQSLVDQEWKNFNFKDLVFGDLWRFLDTSLALVLLISTGRTTRNVARELIMAGPRRGFFCYLALNVIVLAAFGIVYKVPVTFVPYFAYICMYFGQLGFQYCAIHFDSSFRFILATFVFMLSRRGLIIGSHLALVICYFDENYVELASIPVFLLLSTVAGTASIALFLLIGPLQMPFGTSLLVKNVRCFINANLGFYRLLLSIFIGLIVGFFVATWFVSNCVNVFDIKTPTSWRLPCAKIATTSFLLSLNIEYMFELSKRTIYRDIFVTEEGDSQWGPYYILLVFAVFYHNKLTLTAPHFYFVIVFPLFICFTFYEEWCCFYYIKHVQKWLPNSSTTLALMASGEFNVKLLKSALDDKFSSLKLKILDFAGDKEYYAYHHMFLKSQAIYLIVFNIAKLVDNNFRGIVRLQFWLESVCSHVPPKTPIFLVGTHRGDMDKNCMEHLNGHLKTNLWDFYCDELVVNGVDELIFFPVENSKGENDFGVQSLRTKIMSVAEESLVTIDCDIPLSWIRIQDAIIHLREKKEANFCVTLEEFPRAFGNFICTNWSVETLKYFHEKGLVIYLDKNQELSEWVLLKPEILVDIIIQLVTPPQQMTQERGFRRDWKLLQDKGMLTKSLLESIISNVQEDEEAMTAFLEEYDLICPLSNKKVEMCSLSDDEEYQPTHFVPSLLPVSADCCIPVWHDSTTDKTFYVFFKRFLPEPLFHRLLSRAHKNSKVEFPNGPTVVFRDVGKFWMSPWQPYRLKLMKEEGVIEVTFSSSNKYGMKPADVLCQVFSMVDGICKRDFPFVKFHCGPACSADECPGYHDNYMYTPHQHTRRHVYNVMPGRQGDNIASLYCVNNSFEEELEEWIP